MNKMFTHNKNKIIVIGGNAAGPAAAAKAKRTNPNADVTLIEAGNFISTGTCEIPYVLSKEIDDVKKIIFFDNQKFKEEKGVNVLTNNFVESIDRRNKIIIVRNNIDGSHYSLNYDKLILATGSKAKKIIEISEANSNIFTLKIVGDLIRLQNYILNKNPKHAVIVGAGYIGLETAEALSNLKIRTTLIEKENYPLPGSETEIQRLIHEYIQNKDIEFIGGYSKINFVHSNGLTKIVVDSRIIEPDLIIQSIGVEANSQLAISCGLSVGKFSGVAVDQKLKTSDPNIFAAGDVIEVVNKVTKQKDYLPLATLAHRFGHIAGSNAAGGNDFYQPVVKNIAVKIFEKTFSSVGITTAQAEKFGFRIKSVTAIANNIIKVMPTSNKVFGKLIVDANTNKILGASFLGGSEVIGFADLISLMIQSELTVDKLTEVYFNYTPPKSPFVNLLSILGRKVKELR